MIKKAFRIKIDTARGINHNINNIFQGDNKAYKFYFTLLDDNESIVLTGLTARIFFKKSDNTQVFSDLVITAPELGKAEIELTNQVYSVAGTVKAEIVIYSGEEAKRTLPAFSFVVGKPVHDDEAIESQDEFTALTSALGQVQNIDNRFNETLNKIGNLSQIPENDLVTAIQNNRSSLAERTKISVKEFGAKGDGYLIDSTLTIKGTSHPVKKYVGTDDTIKIQEAINYCATNDKALYFPKGVYICTSDLIIPSTLKIEGEDKYKALITKAIIIIAEGASNTTVSNIGIVGEYDIFTPTLQITTDATNMLLPEYWNYMDFTGMGFSGDGIRIRGAVDNVTKNITVSNCYFAMRCNGVANEPYQMNLRTDGDICIQNVLVDNCLTEHIWWHGVATRYTKTAKVSNCTFNNHYVGMMCDFSRGTIDSIMTHCHGYSVADMFKNESVLNGINHNCIISNNIWYSPKHTDPHYKYYYGHTTGSNVIVTGNQIFGRDWTRGFRVAGENTVFSNNIIELIEFAGNGSPLFEVYNYVGITGSLTLENNMVINKSTVRPTIVKTSSGMSNVVQHIIIKNNTFKGAYQNLLDLENGKDVIIEKNTVELCVGDAVIFRGVVNLSVERNDIKCNNVFVIKYGTSTNIANTITVDNNILTDIVTVFYCDSKLTCGHISVSNNKVYGLKRLVFYFGEFLGGNNLQPNYAQSFISIGNQITLTDTRVNTTVVFLNNDSKGYIRMSNFFINNRSDSPTVYNIVYDIRSGTTFHRNDFGVNVGIPA